MLPRRRSADRGSRKDRRRIPDRRVSHETLPGRYRFPSWQEQRIQFFTRYLFLLLGVLFFNVVDDIRPAAWTLSQLNAAFALYFVINTVLFVHASRHHVYPPRYHLAMWLDILITSISVLNDPYGIPPSLLVFIMVVLGNGMRYGMRLFGEALVGCFAAAMVVLSVRHMQSLSAVSPGLLFLNLFGGIILVYAYILMGRIERSRAELERHSSLDTLTGLLNRRALEQVAERMFQRLQRGQQGFAILFADLDKFKAVNDLLGHATGDRVLKSFADIVRLSIRNTDVAARFGGDEFVIFLEDATLEDAETVATRIQEQVASWAVENQVDFSVTFGLGEAPAHGASFADLLEQVDKALYHSKTAHARGGFAHARCADSATG